MLSQGAHTHTRANTLTHPQRGSIISNRPGLGQREDVSSIFPLQRREQRSVLWRSQQKEFPWTQQCFYSAHFYFFAVLPSHKASFFLFHILTSHQLCCDKNPLTHFVPLWFDNSVISQTVVMIIHPTLHSFNADTTGTAAESLII